MYSDTYVQKAIDQAQKQINPEILDSEIHKWLLGSPGKPGAIERTVRARLEDKLRLEEFLDRELFVNDGNKPGFNPTYSVGYDSTRI